MALFTQHQELAESECNGFSLADRGDLLEEQAEEITAQAKSTRVLDWTVRSLVDPMSLVQ